jgi:hypothetical protein
MSSGFFTPQLVFKTTPWRPVIFTAKDDDSVGDQIRGSTGSPSGFYANPAFYFGGDGTSGRPAKFQRREWTGVEWPELLITCEDGNELTKLRTDPFTTPSWQTLFTRVW